MGAAIVGVKTELQPSLNFLQAVSSLDYSPSWEPTSAGSRRPIDRMSHRPMLFRVGLVLGASLGAASCAGAACTGPQSLQTKVHAHPGAAAYTELGNWFGDHHQFACAVEAFRSALKYDPKSGRLHYLVGLGLFSSDHAEESVAELQKSIELEPGVLKPHLVLASAFDQLHRSSDAEAEWEAALKVDPTSAIALDGLANSLLAQGDSTAVIGLLRSAKLDDKLALDLGIAYGRAKMWDDAAEALKPALEKSPSNLALATALVTVYVRQTRYEEAAKLAESSARLHPDDLNSQALYLRVLVLNNDNKRAAPLAKKLLASAPHNFDLLYLSGVIDNAAGEYESARKHLQEAVQLDPKHYNSRYNLGLALMQLHDPQAAKEQFEKALELGAYEPEVRFNLASALRALGQADAAKEQLLLYQKELKAKKDRTLAALKSGQAANELASGDPQKAVALYREALDATPQDPVLAYKLAMAMDKAGDTESERTLLEQAVKLDPTLALAQNQLGYLASRNGDNASAEQYFKAALQAAPGFTDAWISLAATFAMESRLSDAKDALSIALKLDPSNAQAQQLSQDLGRAAAQP
jgi:tetratricopeptide (TPR) repeat protein